MRAAGIIVHYAEVATKGRNRPKFLKRLSSNLGSALAGLPFGRIQRLSGRFWVPAKEELDLEQVRERLSTVYGISSWSPALRSRVELEELKAKALQVVEGMTYETFRVSSRRVFKDLKLGSLEVDREVGAHLFEHHPAKVKLKGAEVQVFIEMMPDGAYVYADKVPGPRGLPVGMTGRVACLLSGGIDSPVAAARMQRRGCHALFIHFHSHPFLSRASQDKALEMGAYLTRYQRWADLHMVPFGELQREIVANAPAALRVVLYRRFMLRIAGRIALQHKARALVTGESLAQVASQTLTNMVTIESASPLPILRPLIGFDKQEIVDEAHALGTYETSIIPDQDCCTLFVPRSPETHAKPEAVAAAEANLDIDRLCDEALAQVELHELRAPWIRPRAGTGTPGANGEWADSETQPDTAQEDASA